MKRLAVLLLLIAGCSQVPNDSMGTGGVAVSEADNRRYEEYVLDGRGAFLEETRTVKGVELSHERYKLALQIRSDNYTVLWEAARTAVWLGNYGAKEKQDSYVRDGIRYANTAVKLKPEGEEGLFYDGVLAGKLADLDINYGPSGLEIIVQRMKQLIDLNSKHVYGGPHRVLAIVLMRSPGSPLGPGVWDEAEKHMTRALEIDPNWPENQLYMAELEFGLAKKRGDPKYAESARARLQKHFLDEGTQAPMGSGYEFIYWQTDARNLIEANK